MTTLVFHPGLHHAGIPFVQHALRLSHNLLGSMRVAYVDPSLYADELQPIMRHLDEEPDPGGIGRVREVLEPIILQYRRLGFETILFCDPFLGGDPNHHEQRRLYPGFERRMETLRHAFPDYKIKAFLSLPLVKDLMSGAPEGYWPRNPDGFNPSRLLGVIGTVFGRERIGVAFHIPQRPEEAFYRLLEFIGINRDDHWKVALPPVPRPPADAVSPDVSRSLEKLFDGVYEDIRENPQRAAARAPL